MKDEVPVEGVDIPCIIEAWATCERASKADSGVELMICVNGTPVPGDVAAWFQKAQLVVQGCGLRNLVGNVSAGIYDVTVNITAPCVPITTEGKEPHLLPFLDPLGDAIISACKGAKRDLGADSGMSIKEAADAVMKDAYLKASGNGTYPANARQIMYAARPQILELTGGRIWEKDTYFTQTLLPDYMAEHPDETADWDVVFDARGALIEPHTRRSVPLGTIETREYSGGHFELGPAVPVEVLYPIIGPTNRYKAVLFIEKEGFEPLLRAARIAERYDIAIMSTKGMPVVAARWLLDALVKRGDIEKVLVARDFDVSGFSIVGTLTNDNRRYKFENDIPVIDIGLRLADVREMGLEAEPTDAGDKKGWPARCNTLQRHGADEAEIEVLKNQRVELNAMTSDQFIAWLERKLEENGITKLVPDAAVLADAARRSYRQRLVAEVLAEHEAELDQRTHELVLPADLDDQVENVLDNDSALSWDEAVSDIVEDLLT